MSSSATEADDDDEPTAQINIVPFVDIVLVLLVIFLLTSKIIARAAFPIDLPTAAHAGEVVDVTANVVITASGELLLDGAATTRDALRDGIRKRLAAEPKLRAVIAADKGLRYEQVIEVIDTVKGAGVTAFALNIQRAAGPKP